MVRVVHILIADGASIFRWILLLVFIFDHGFKQCASNLVLPACENMHEISLIRIGAENFIRVFVCVFFVLELLFELVRSQQECLLVKRQCCLVVLLAHVNVSNVVVTKVINAKGKSHFSENMFCFSFYLTTNPFRWYALRQGTYARLI